jgi:hypothetical protein
MSMELESVLQAEEKRQGQEVPMFVSETAKAHEEATPDRGPRGSTLSLCKSVLSVICRLFDRGTSRE